MFEVKYVSLSESFGWKRLSTVTVIYIYVLVKFVSITTLMSVYLSEISHTTVQKKFNT